MAPNPHAPLPAFRRLEVDSSPHGLVIRPRAMAVSWLIEAAVWIVGAGGAAAMLLLSQTSWVRVLGGLLLVPIGIRALIRTVRFASAKWLRKLSIAWNVPRPLVAGPFARAALDTVVGFDVKRHGNDLYFDALDARGAATHLVAVEPDEAPDYLALAAWLAARGFHG